MGLALWMAAFVFHSCLALESPDSDVIGKTKRLKGETYPFYHSISQRLS